MIWFPKKNGGNSSEESESGLSPSYPSHSQPDFNQAPADNSTNPSITAADQASGRPVPTSGTANPASGSSSVDCLSRIENVISSKGRGVIMKLYLENFKRLNQVFGYHYCQQLLSQIIQYLEKKTKHPVYRYIGVEFILILENYTQGQASALAEEILEQFDHVWKVENTDCLCSAQIGFCSYPGYADNTDEMLKYLDEAVTKAADMGPNQYACYDSVLQAVTLRKQAIAKYLQTALENQEIEVRYRPTFHTATGRFTRAEFYMRIFIQGIGMVGADEFLPIAEDSGQIRAIEYFALNQVGRCISNLILQGKEFDSVSLPISPLLFLQEDFLDEVERVMDTYKIPAGKLALEIEESTLTTAYLNINTSMQELEEMGVELILNGFGSGVSSITSILELPVHTLKFERTFIWQMETNPRSLPVIRGLLSIAEDLNLNVIAEGVETENQVSLLNSYKCPYLQGFYYSPTVTKDTLMEVIGSTLDESRQTILKEKEKMRR